MTEDRGAAKEWQGRGNECHMCHTECEFNWKGEEELPKDFKQCNGMVRTAFGKLTFSFFGGT